MLVMTSISSLTSQNSFLLKLNHKYYILFVILDWRNMNDKGIKSAIRTRIGSLPEDAVFSVTDFADIASSDNIRQAFKELSDEGAIERAARGVYYKPRYLALLDRTVPPSIEKVAEAVARARGWIIVPSGDHALNMLGLDTQVPAVYAYISTGPYTNLQVGPIEVSFKHSTSKNLVGMSRITLLVIQALKALGRENVDDRVIAHLSRRLNDDERAALLEETQRSTAWIRQAARKIAEGEAR